MMDTKEMLELMGKTVKVTKGVYKHSQGTCVKVNEFTGKVQVKVSDDIFFWIAPELLELV